MKNHLLISGLLWSLVSLPGSFIFAGEQRINLPNNAFDGGVISAETLGRGGVFASASGHPGSAGENPAALATGITDGFYLTTYLGMTTDVEESSVSSRHPLQDRVLQYMAIQGDKGVLFYEPLGRIGRRDIVDFSNPSTDFNETEFSADAIGFSGAQELRNGSFGLSIAYIRADFSQRQSRSGQNDVFLSDRGDGFRMNFGLRYPTGPVMWGITLKNAPGFLFWKDHKRSILPFTVRAGNSYRVKPGTIFSFDAEKKFYKEGAIEQETLYFGWEQRVKENIIFRAGVFSEELDDPDHRHYTGGLSIKTGGNLTVTYAAEQFKLDNEKVTKSILSLTLPFQGASGDETPVFSSSQ